MKFGVNELLLGLCAGTIALGIGYNAYREYSTRTMPQQTGSNVTQTNTTKNSKQRISEKLEDHRKLYQIINNSEGLGGRRLSDLPEELDVSETNLSNLEAYARDLDNDGIEEIQFTAWDICDEKGCMRHILRNGETGWSIILDHYNNAKFSSERVNGFPVIYVPGEFNDVEGIVRYEFDPNKSGTGGYRKKGLITPRDHVATKLREIRNKRISRDEKAEELRQFEKAVGSIALIDAVLMEYGIPRKNESTEEYAEELIKKLNVYSDENLERKFAEELRGAIISDPRLMIAFFGLELYNEATKDPRYRQETEELAKTNSTVDGFIKYHGRLPTPSEKAYILKHPDSPLSERPFETPNDGHDYRTSQQIEKDNKKKRERFDEAIKEGNKNLDNAVNETTNRVRRAAGNAIQDPGKTVKDAGEKAKEAVGNVKKGLENIFGPKKNK